MERKAVSGIMLTLLLLSTLTVAFNIQPARGSGTIYIRADGSIDPPTAPIQRVGNVYTFTGNITDSIEVQRDNIEIDGASFTVKGTGIQDSFGINLYSRRNVIVKNTRITSFYFGIYLGGSSNNTLIGNTITNNDGFGIGLHSSSNNTLVGNTIKHNSAGISGYDAFNNVIYHNNFLYNPEQVLFTSYTARNRWDDGYPSGGNYWSDYLGTDSDGDGIGDTPYVIDANNKDRWPLMNPWTPTPPAPDFSITASPTSLTIQQGDSDTSVITITSIGGFNQPIQLTVSGAQSGVTTTLNPEQITPPPDDSTTSTLTVLVGATAAPGSYTLTVSGSNGTLTHSVDISLEITALPPPTENQPPVADAGLDQSVSSGDLIQFDASDSYDPDGTIVSYRWDFGDGETAEGHVVEHRFRGAMDQSKTYTATLTVEDEKGSMNTDIAYVTVEPLEKTIEISGEPLLHPGSARMKAYYNWIGVTEINGQSEDIYIVSKIHFEGQGYISYVLSIWDSYSFLVGIPVWSRGLVYFGRPVEKDFVYPFGTRRDKTYTFDDGYFEGMTVGPSDVMRLWGFTVKIISGVAGPIYDGASASFDPSSITEPEEEMPNSEFVHLASPGELRVYDSQGRITGLVNGEVKEEIPYSGYNNNTVLIPFLSDSYRYEVAGTGEGSYNLTVTHIVDQKTNNFVATAIHTLAHTIHQYTIDWSALSQGEEGVTVKVDSDGDGVFELTFTSDNELARDEFMSQVSPAEAFPMWIVGIAIAAVTIATVTGAVFWRRRKRSPTKE